MDSNTIVVVGAFIVTLVGNAVHATWALSRIETALRKDIQTSRDETDDRIERQGRQFGEIIAALRQKITEVELYIRDNFVSKSSFEGVLTRIEKQLSRMEEKIDSKT